MKNQNPESRYRAGSVESRDDAFSPADLVDRIQREAFRERFNRAPGGAYPSLEALKRAITESY